MNARATWVWCALASLLALALLWFFVFGAEHFSQDARLRIFGALESEDIVRFQIATSDGVKATLAREGGGWRIREPFDFPADALAADAIASALAGLRAEVVYETPEALKHYGLTGPPRIEFSTARGEAHALRVGGTAPIGDGRYMSDASARRVFLTPAWRAGAFTRSFDELRDARVLDFEIPAVRGLRARWPGGAVEVERVPGGWRLVSPVAAPAGAERIEALLERLLYLRAAGFLDAPAEGAAPDDAALGLSPPSFALELELEGSDTPRHFALGGEKSEGEKKRRAARGREGRLFWVAADVLDALPRTAFAYRAHELSRFLPESIEAIELRYPVSGYPNDPSGKPLHLRLVREESTAGEKTWRVFFLPLSEQSSGVIPNFDFYKELAATMLEEFSVLDAGSVLAETSAKRARYGLRPPRASLRFFESSAPRATPVSALFFGEALPQRGIPVRRSDGGPIFLVPLELAESIPLDAQSFRSELGWSTSEPRAKTNP